MHLICSHFFPSHLHSFLSNLLDFPLLVFQIAVRVCGGGRYLAASSSKSYVDQSTWLCLPTPSSPRLKDLNIREIRSLEDVPATSASFDGISVQNGGKKLRMFLIQYDNQRMAFGRA
ncbi:protein NRT1/ PTR FAMILY 6.1 isoform X1 [Tripterygium wilfordii]|uniref:Protein NRT1/ PTR FAMILY 6.1 isoform X1 n=1 Tax=Tripterygium wilfordii TaxID=458696 RepID=A0A7J7D2J8_TRIWF|nr:uncharacterized protein LOC120008485 isoform X1 [Tripterygium wilfordii]KAF5740469.1 protein NRT1/ PTR FAMILY 6.1 isoform X1 [Tripterygium wilfordii]